MKNLPFIDIKARDNYDFGLQLGAALKAKLRRRLASNLRSLYPSLHFPDLPTLVTRARKFLPAIRKRYPHLLDELRGVSEGAGLPLDSLLVMSFDEELMSLAVPRCTSLAVRQEGRVLLAHNEDWLPGYRRNGLYAVRARIGKRRFLSVAYMGMLPGTVCGLNDSRLCFTGNALTSPRLRYGVPRSLLMRAMLDCRTSAQAIRTYTDHGAIPGNALCAFGDSELFNIEEHLRHHNVFRHPDYLVHTNHPLLPEDQGKENTADESIRRLEWAEDIITKRKVRSERLVREILADHGTGICSHSKKGGCRYGVTIGSVIVDPVAGWMKVSWSNPCRNRYRRFEL